MSITPATCWVGRRSRTSCNRRSAPECQRPAKSYRSIEIKQLVCHFTTRLKTHLEANILTWLNKTHLMDCLWGRLTVRTWSTSVDVQTPASPGGQVTGCITEFQLGKLREMSRWFAPTSVWVLLSFSQRKETGNKQPALILHFLRWQSQKWASSRWSK